MTRAERRDEAIERSCIGKRAYTTPEAAGRAALNAVEARGVGLRIYKCEFCPDFHLTKQTLDERT